MSRLGISIAVLFMLVLLLYVPVWMEDEPADNVRQGVDALRPAYRAKNLTTTLYGNDGKLNHQVFASAMEHYDQLGFVMFQQPEYTLYADVGTHPWKVTADEGTLYDDNLIQLESQVVIENLNPDDLVGRVTTDYIQINLDTKMMTSDQPVEISGVEYLIRSNGFTADLNTRQYELIDHVQTIYAPNP
ncbi:LPS export ABC transporter periplasmic protein LptC [Alteromonas aestuariivivens]|uniref:Lipopolysaccharide export system protein LptC n=1 Tax=Alteromonas aestuariivivens TaxID=1938339 RepID=A0A3D8MD03_9ALTE|nr:LPS export ABC transporter periplasmic protein LptC [Alteromonas aestuariivivens]RDV28109.1 LPS export ABC transporter periplasmic protein LptC [Alteromonas aestuariivivens]